MATEAVARLAAIVTLASGLSLVTVATASATGASERSEWLSVTQMPVSGSQ